MDFTHTDLFNATWRALNEPGGEEILERMLDKQMSVLDGLCALAIMSGDFERLPGAETDQQRAQGE